MLLRGTDYKLDMENKTMEHQIMENKIEINGRKYRIDLDKALSTGALKEIPAYPLNAGDVYTSRDKGYTYNPVLLVKVTYNGDNWQLLGIGASPNSGTFYNQVHTIEEIEAHLTNHNLIFIKNISTHLAQLVH